VTTTGDLIENPVTADRGVVRLGTVETAGARAVVDLYVRFEAMILNLFGLAKDGKTNARGLPSLLQLALLAREFRDVIRFTRPPQVVPRPLRRARRDGVQVHEGVRQEDGCGEGGRVGSSPSQPSSTTLSSASSIG